jgi:hypothetical protein
MEHPSAEKDGTGTDHNHRTKFIGSEYRMV